ncbi:MAG: response regulator [Thermodesulfobacteriota bacterium]
MTDKDKAGKILLVEDDPRSRFMMHEALTDAGFKVDNSIHGRDALKKVGSSFYDLVITDVNMPLLNGFEFYRQAVASDPSFKERFLFISGEPPRQAGDRLISEDRLMLKPFGMAELIESVKTLMRR